MKRHRGNGRGVLRPKHRIAVLSLHPCPGDRICLTTEFGGALFTRYPIGPRPAEGRLSLRVRRRHTRRPRFRAEAPTERHAPAKGEPPSSPPS
jgi:hypothetical protein